MPTAADLGYFRTQRRSKLLDPKTAMVEDTRTLGIYFFRVTPCFIGEVS